MGISLWDLSCCAPLGALHLMGPANGCHAGFLQKILSFHQLPRMTTHPNSQPNLTPLLLLSSKFLLVLVPVSTIFRFWFLNTKTRQNIKLLRSHKRRISCPTKTITKHFWNPPSLLHTKRSCICCCTVCSCPSLDKVAMDNPKGSFRLSTSNSCEMVVFVGARGYCPALREK